MARWYVLLSVCVPALLDFEANVLTWVYVPFIVIDCDRVYQERLEGRLSFPAPS